MEKETPKTSIDDETKNLFREASIWMKSYSIILLVFVSVFFIGFVWAISNTQDLIRMYGGQIDDAKAISQINALLFICLLIISALGFSLFKLLMASNVFYTISFTFKKSEINNAFKNLKLFWMISGMTMIFLGICVLIWF